jgi:hypothetical protein
MAKKKEVAEPVLLPVDKEEVRLVETYRRYKAAMDEKLQFAKEHEKVNDKYFKLNAKTSDLRDHVYEILESYRVNEFPQRDDFDDFGW